MRWSSVCECGGGFPCRYSDIKLVPWGGLEVVGGGTSGFFLTVVASCLVL